MRQKQKIVLGVTGSIAAYKAAGLVRLLVKSGVDVTVVMTSAATEFVRPLTFQTLSRNPVFVDQFATPAEWRPQHVALAEADVVAVAPATANTLAKMRHGIADNLLTSVLLATRAPTLVAPAMNDGMWENAATQENLAALTARGVRVVAPEEGELACGSGGKGRMASPQAVFEAIEGLLRQGKSEV